MTSPAQFVEEWGRDGLCRFPSYLLDEVDLPEQTKEFLTQAGLPQKAEVPLRNHVVPLPLIPESPPVGAARYPIFSRYLLSRYRLMTYVEFVTEYWGYDLYNAVEEGTGLVWLIPAPEPPNCVMNSSVPQFAESLLAYRDFVALFEPDYPSRTEIPPLIDSLKRCLEQIDSEALAHPDNYWPLMIEDMRIQL